MKLADLLSILKRNKSGLARAAELGERLVALDAERDTIIAELAELGFTDATQPTGGIARPVAVAAVGAAVPSPAAVGDLWDLARQQIMAPQLEDFTKGIIDEEKLEKETERRKDLIAQRVKELQAGGAVEPCSQCDVAATTTIAGLAYCDAHAKTAPRLAAPVRIAA